MTEKKVKTLAMNHGEFDHVKFTDQDNHVFFMKMGKAIESCRRLRELEADLEHDELEAVEILTKWLNENKGLFSAVVVRPHGGGLVLFFAPLTTEFDVRLSEKLAELESAAVSRLNALSIETRQVSPAELEELREIERVRRHADHGSARQPVEA